MHLRQSILGLFFLVSSSFALSNTEFTYNVIDGGIEVTGCVGSCPSELVIPAEIDGYYVISIGYAAFGNELTSITIASGVSNIDEYALANNKLSTVAQYHNPKIFSFPLQSVNQSNYSK